MTLYKDCSQSTMSKFPLAIVCDSSWLRPSISHWKMPLKFSCSTNDEWRSGVRGEGMSPQLFGSCVLKAKSQLQLLSLLHPVVTHDGEYKTATKLH